MEQILEGLNRRQREAVLFGEGPLLILAGAGTGKTSVITRRIAYLVSSKAAKPSEILALTFTEKAAAQMEERVDLLVPYGWTDVWISTFHSFGDRILREHALDIGLSSSFRLMSRPEQIIFLREHLFDLPLDYYRPLGNPTKFLDAILKLISRAKDEDLSCREYVEFAHSLEKRAAQTPEDKDYLKQQTELARTYSKYQELMGASGNIDFGDQVALVLKLFRKHPAILKKYQESFKYILVDEFQDTNYSQFELVRMLSTGHKNITVVGDDDQAIYRFRGAALANILKFTDIYPDANQLVLNENYRSTQVILDRAYQLIQYNNPIRLEVRNNVDKRLVSHREGKEDIVHVHCESHLAEADEVARIIEEYVKTGGAYRDTAVLVRSNNGADLFMRAFNLKEIPYIFSGSRGLYHQQEVRLLTAFLRTISDFNDSSSLYYFASEFYNIDLIDMNFCLSFARRSHKTLHYIFRTIERKEESSVLKDATRKKIKRIMGDIEHYCKLSKKFTLPEVLYEFLKRSGYLESLIKKESPENEKRLKNIARFFQITKNITESTGIKNPLDFVQYLDMLIESGDDPSVGELSSDEDAVNILTVHKAKGLEFEIVFMVSLLKNKFPWTKRSEEIALPDELMKDIIKSEDSHIQEERRLFYVGMTRAKTRLYFTSAEDYGGRRRRKVSRFVMEALGLSKEEVKGFMKRSALEEITSSSPAQERITPAISSKSRLLKLTPYQIDDYLSCPLKYKYVHILKIPIIQHHSVAYGAALHKTVQEYFKARIAGAGMEKQALFEIFNSAWISEGFLSAEHEKHRLEAGRNTLEKFYRAQEELDILPTYIERPFSFLLNENIKISGRWDRIDEVNEEAVIIDFKSSDVREQKKADVRAKESLQLGIYALAYKSAFEKLPDRVELYFLESGVVGKAVKTEEMLAAVTVKIQEAAEGISASDFSAKPDYMSCRYCAYTRICPKQER